MYLEINKSKEHQEALEWMQHLISNSLRSSNPNAMAVSHILVTWNSILENPVELEVPKPAPVPKAKAPVKKKSRAKGKKKETGDAPFECSKHSTYGGQRRPRSDCPRCWEIYKQLHPMDYDIKRRDFERKMTA